MSKKKQTKKKSGKATTKAKAKAGPASDPDRVPLSEAMKPASKARKPKAIKATAAKAAKAPGAKAKEKPARRPSGLDVAAQLLKDAGEPMRCQAIVDAAIAKGLWTSGGKTPAATISAAIGREVTRRGAQSRFRKTAPGLFAFNG